MSAHTESGATPLHVEFPLHDSPRAFRLIELEPHHGDFFNSQIKLKYVPADLCDADLNYWALSYVWGDTMASQKMTTNLLLALLELRTGIKNPQKIWIDALCIDQSYTVERNRQVQLMREIYNKAKLVIIHLGTSEDSCEKVPELLEQITSANTAPFKDAEGHVPPKHYVDSGLPPYDHDDWGILVRFFKRPWFHRCWTLQEIHFATAAVFMCEGWRQSVAWLDLAGLVEEIIDGDLPCHISYSAKMRTTIISPTRLGGYNICKKAWPNYRDPSLLALLSMTREAECSDHRDYVFAHLALSEDKSEPQLAPDYSLDLTEVLLNVARYFVRSGQGLRMLNECFLQDEDSSLPSWVPFWPSRSYHRATFPGLSTTDQEQQGIREIENRILVVKGHIVDLVSHCGALNRVATQETLFNLFSDDHALAVSYGNEMASLAMHNGSYESYKEPREYLPWAVLLSPGLNEGSSTFDELVNDKRLLPFFLEWIPRIVFDEATMQLTIDGDISRIMSEHEILDYVVKTTTLHGEIHSNCSGRRMYCTSHGYLGYADPLTQVGDAMVFLSGNSTPFVLRPSGFSNNGRQCYKIVGHAYVHDPRRYKSNVGECGTWSSVTPQDLYIV